MPTPISSRRCADAWTQHSPLSNQNCLVQKGTPNEADSSGPVRPCLLRTIDHLYVHCPDRLARNYAHQVLLLEEFLRAGVEVIFLNREVGQTPEDQLLLQVQGMIAEYERAKILERSRRGKRHAAQVGRVSVLSCAPYGYRYVTKQEGAGAAHFEVVGEEARVVRPVFEWVGRDRCSIV